MDGIKVVIVEPCYQINLGYIARVMKNFGFKKLYLVNPRCDYKGKEAIKYSKHAHELLENATIYKNLEDAKNGFVIGTTGLWRKTNVAYYNWYTLDRLSKMVKSNRLADKNITLLIGRDDTGLSKDELKNCDATIYIGTSREYPVLNISHALAIILYELTKSKFIEEYSFANRFYADEDHKKRVLGLFNALVSKNKSIKDKKSVVLAFEHMLNRSMPTKKEVNALAIALSSRKNRKRLHPRAAHSAAHPHARG